MTATQRLILANFKSAAMAGGGGMSVGGAGGMSGGVASGGGGGMPAPSAGGAAISPFMGGGQFSGRGTLAGLARAKRTQPTYAGAPSVQNVGGKLYAGGGGTGMQTR